MRVTINDLWRMLASDTAQRDYHEQLRLGVDPYREPGPGEPVNLALEMRELHQKLHGVLPAKAVQFLDEIKAAMERGDAEGTSSWAECPYDPVYQAKTNLFLAGERVPSGYEFHFNVHLHNYRGGIEMAPRFDRSSSWDEEVEDDR